MYSCIHKTSFHLLFYSTLLRGPDLGGLLIGIDSMGMNSLCSLSNTS